jgi:hypothetical protein
MKAISLALVKVVELLLSKGANIEAKNVVINMQIKYHVKMSRVNILCFKTRHFKHNVTYAQIFTHIDSEW